MNPFYRPLLPLIYATIAFTALNATDYATGTQLWLAWTLYPAALAFLVCESLYLLSGRQKLPAWSLIAILAFLSSMCCFMAGELALTAYEYLAPTSPKLAMPKDWEWQPSPVNGALDSFMWQGAEHLKDREGMRHAGPWPEKTTKPRILVVGDSLTYGLGVPIEDTYPAQLQALLPNYEVLNLGVVGLNSTQILNVLIDKIPALHPDLIIYGICLNDLLPYNKAQEKADDRYSPPIPYWLRDPLITRTRLGKAMNTGYEKLLMSLGLRQTFIDEILSHPEYQQRFREDLSRMQEVVRTAYQLPPIIGMVLDQYPQLDSPSSELTKKIERIMEEVWMEPVYTSHYYRQHNGQAMFVSPWEGHPNKAAYAIWAGMLKDHILQ